MMMTAGNRSELRNIWVIRKFVALISVRNHVYIW